MSKIDLKELDKAATQGIWGQFNADTGPFQSQAGAFLDNRRDEYWAYHDTSHHMSTLVDGNPKRLAEFTHAADAAFAEALVNAYRAGDLVADEWNRDMSKAPKKLPQGEFLLVLHDPSKPHTIYTRHAELFGCPAYNGRGIFQAAWGGAYQHNGETLPDWWFVDDEDFETALNPISWKRITTPEVG